LSLAIIITAGFIFNLIFIPGVLAAHFVVGKVHDAFDGTSSDGLSVVVWNPGIGEANNISDIIGPGGNSGTNEVFMLDCELLNPSCRVGDILYAKVLDSEGHFSKNVSLSVSGAGYDVFPDMRVNSRPHVLSWVVDDSFTEPLNEIDLTPMSVRNIVCEGVIVDYDGEGELANASAEFFHADISYYGDEEDNNHHYSNSSCYLNNSYGGGNESYVKCDIDVWYYANDGGWNCTVKTYDNFSTYGFGSNYSYINSLIALSLNSVMDFGLVSAGRVSGEATAEVENAGNVAINLSLSGYASSEGDENAMNCNMSFTGIPISNLKYNLSESNPGILDFEQHNLLYFNLTSNVRKRAFNLDYRKNDIASEAVKDTFWRVLVPVGAGGTCSGNIVFGAVRGAEN
jgi:hypothetical protein